ncbi:MAG: capsid protein [Inoviridae sp.]|nr:MAG: capsid protein [Inoviridae sp.]
MLSKLKIALVGVISLGAGQAMAAVPAEATTAVTDLVTDAGTFIGSLWPLLVAVVVGFIFMKIFKKGVSRAT